MLGRECMTKKTLVSLSLSLRHPLVPTDTWNKRAHAQRTAMRLSILLTVVGAVVVWINLLGLFWQSYQLAVSTSSSSDENKIPVKLLRPAKRAHHTAKT